VCGVLVAGPYFVLGRSLFEGQKLSKRTYRYAD